MTRILRIDGDFSGFIRDDPLRPRHPRSIDAFFAAVELVSGQLTLGREARAQQSAEGDLAYLFDYLFRGQTSVWMVPAREP